MMWEAPSCEKCCGAHANATAASERKRGSASSASDLGGVRHGRSERGASVGRARGETRQSAAFTHRPVDVVLGDGRGAIGQRAQ